MNKQFTVLNHEYISTGGHCMVSIFTVYDRTAKKTLYVLVDDDSVNMTSFDYISNELPDGIDYEDVIIISHTWDALTCEPSFDQQQIADEEHELLKHCQFEFIKKDCKHFNRKVSLAEDQFTYELFHEVPAEVVEWHRRTGENYLTDGYRVYPSEAYTIQALDEIDGRVEAAKLRKGRGTKEVEDFNSWITQLARDGAFVDDRTAEFLCNFTISIGGRTLVLPVHADNIERLQSFLTEVAADY